MMNTMAAALALEEAFRQDIEDGTIEVQWEAGTAFVNGGNWWLLVCTNGTVRLDMPSLDKNYYDADPDTFLQNVISADVEEALAAADQELGGVLAAGLRKSKGKCGARLAERLVTTKGGAA
jgi:hypothetical protein